jgi:hypothetical protein
MMHRGLEARNPGKVQERSVNSSSDKGREHKPENPLAQARLPNIPAQAAALRIGAHHEDSRSTDQQSKFDVATSKVFGAIFTLFGSGVVLVGAESLWGACTKSYLGWDIRGVQFAVGASIIGAGLVYMYRSVRTAIDANAGRPFTGKPE